MEENTATTMTEAPTTPTGSEGSVPDGVGQAPDSIITNPQAFMEEGQPSSNGFAFSEELANEPSLQNFQDHNALAKSYVNLVKKMGVPSEQLLRLPSEDGEGWDDVYNALGRPENSEGYQFSQEHPEGYDQYAHELGLNQHQADAILNSYHDLMASEEEADAEEYDQSRVDNLQMLQQDWKHSYQENADLANRAFMQFATPELVDLVNETGIGSDPEMVKFLYRIGSFLAEDNVLATHPSQGGLSPDQAQTRIDELLTDEGFKGKYFNAYAPGHQEAVDQYTRLFQQAHG